MEKVKSFEISKRTVWESWLKVKANGGSAGVDKVSIETYEEKLKSNLYRLWNRMSSGSYFPQPVRLVQIPKSSGGSRPLGIPTVDDRIAQGVLVLTLEGNLEKNFHEDSFGFRPNRSAHEAVETARVRCLQRPWVIDLDIEKFFDSIDHDLIIAALRKHQTSKWMELYVRRWLVAPSIDFAGNLTNRSAGTPQGGVASPLLANLFLHYAFDLWMARNLPVIKFERYVDDIVVHCFTRQQAEHVLKCIKDRFTACKLSIHPEKTKIVFCKKEGRSASNEKCSFDFLGFQFRPRMGPSKQEGAFYLGFTPAISRKAQTKLIQTIKGWRLSSLVHLDLKSIAKRINPIVRGWFNYYGKFYPSLCKRFIQHVNRHLVRWLLAKVKKYHGHKTRAHNALRAICSRDPDLFFHWSIGVFP